MIKSMGIIVDRADNVCTVVTEVEKDSVVICKYSKHLKEEIKIYAKNDIPVFHKIAIEDLSQGIDIVKYGEIIGKAKKSICKGEHVHIHNLDSKRVQGDLDH